jgi:catechol 2,3-dioxygenase-like lactoylglutathione lyase family enzyme
VQYLHAVILVIPDYDDAIAFYVGVLGFTLDQDIPLEGAKRWVRITPPGADSGSLILARAANAKQSRVIGTQTGGRVGFFLVTDDFARDHSAMRAKGVLFEEQPRLEPYGTVAVWRDPFGNRWDLIQWTVT